MSQENQTDYIVPLLPAHFFAFSLDCHKIVAKKLDFLKSRFALPDFSEWLDQETNARAFLGWSEGGLYFSIDVQACLEKVLFPDFRAGDSLELFIDTRDVKTSSYNTRFCHHFVFLPDSIAQEDGVPIQIREVTRFRSDDLHPLADPDLCGIKIVKNRSSYKMAIFIDKTALHGYSPGDFDRIGFSYRLNRFGKEPQYFNASDRDFSLETQPHLWASVNLLN